MKYAERVQRMAGDAAEGWAIHEAASKLMAKGVDVISLSIGDTDFATPTSVVEAANDALARGRTSYANCSGILPLREAIAKRHQKKTGQSTSADQVVVNLGAQNALYSASQCLLDNDCEVIVPEPMYITYPATIEGAGAKLVLVESRAANNFHPTAEDIAAAITDKTRAIYLATPNNPTGAVYTRDELMEIAALCQKHDLWLVSDEVYGDLTYGVEHVSAASIPNMADRSVVISSLSKSHAMAGWRLGWSIVPTDLAKHMDLLALCSTYGTPTFIQDAAVAAIEGMPEGIPEMKIAYSRRRDDFCGRLDAMDGLSCRKPEGGMFAMLDVRGTGMSAQDFAWGLLEAQRVSTLPADAFGPSAKGFIRINLGVDDKLLDETIKRIAAFMEAKK